MDWRYTGACALHIEDADVVAAAASLLSSGPARSVAPAATAGARVGLVVATGSVDCVATGALAAVFNASLALIEVVAQASTELQRHRKPRRSGRGHRQRLGTRAGRAGPATLGEVACHRAAVHFAYGWRRRRRTWAAEGANSCVAVRIHGHHAKLGRGRRAGGELTGLADTRLQAMGKSIIQTPLKCMSIVIA